MRPRGTGDTAAALVHRARLRDVDVVERYGVRVTSVARTLADLGRSRSVLHTVPAMDAALQGKLTTRAEIEDAQGLPRLARSGTRDTPWILPTVGPSPPWNR